MTDLSQTTTHFYPWEESKPDRDARPRNPFTPFEASDLDKTIPQRFQEMVERYPEHVAAKGARHELTYRALNALANRLAWAILAEGTGRSPMVALLCEHDAPAMAALMGILKAGRAYVPLDAAYPRARIEYILQDSQADLIVADGAHLELARELAAGADSETPCRVLNVEALDAGLSSQDPDLALSRDDYAYIIYTSGTTGQPKGVLGTHRQMLHQSWVFVNAHHYCPEDRIGLLASLTFSGSLAYIFPALLCGAALLPFDVRKEGAARVPGWLTRERVTVYGSVPMLFRQMCAALPQDFVFPDLRTIRLGGDRIEKGDLALYKRHTLPHCVFRAGYGTTEAKIITQHFMNHDTEIEGLMPVGYPVMGVEVLLLDRQGQPVQDGEIGEMAVKSRYLAPGYWNRPELTREKFLSTTTDNGQAGEERIYLTGDLGRRAPNGCLTHMGRVDSQVKIRGFRIEIAEVEAALLDLDVVDQAAVIVRSGPGGEPQLVGYLVPTEQPAPTTTLLRQALGERLPDYMIPALFVPLDEMPLNANDKIDRRALPEPESSRPDLETAYLAPRTEMEQALAQIWQTVLDVQPVGVRDSFFELGGHSLLAVRLFARIKQRWDRELPLLTLLQAPTIEQLAALLDEQAQNQRGSLLVPIQPGGTRLPFFCVIPPRSSAVGLAGLASHLGTDQPVYGLQYHRLQAEDEDLAQTVVGGVMPSVPELARIYIQHVRQVQPEGPYALGGRCFGGTIAFEMAQQLSREGQQVELLALFGSAPPTYKRGAGQHLARRMAYHRRQGRLLTVLLGYLPIKAAKARRRLDWQAKKLANRVAGRPTPGSGPKPKYIPRIYAGRLTVFQTSEALREAWAELAAAGMDYHVIGGSHLDMFREPLVTELAARLRTCLDQAEETITAP